MKKSQLRNIIKEQVRKAMEPKRSPVKPGEGITPTPVQMGPDEPAPWDAGSGAINGWVCAYAPFPVGTGAGCYYSQNGVYTNQNTNSPNYGLMYNLPCIPVGYPGGSCFQYQGDCNLNCLHT